MATEGPFRTAAAAASRVAEPPVILIVAASALADRLAALLGSDYTVSAAPDSLGALQYAAARTPDVVLLEASSSTPSGEPIAELRRHRDLANALIAIYGAIAGDAERVTLTLGGANRPPQRAWRLTEVAAWIEGALAQRRYERARLRESNERLAGIIDSALDAVISVDEWQRIRVFNRAAELILRDITAQRQAETSLGQLRGEMEEMLALHVASQTAAAIAHELNQPLNAIASYSETALRLVHAGNPKPDRLLHALESGVGQAHRAAKVVRELIEFLHRGETPLETVDLNDAVTRALSVVESNGFGGFRGVVDLAPDLKPVWANRLHVEKVLANLVRNGVEAMRGAGIRSQAITISVRTAADGDNAQVTVRDTGPGLDERTARRIFEPFFTTKNKGIGMGLAISRALIEAHGGKLWVDAGDAAGAAFHFTLPFAE